MRSMDSVLVLQAIKQVMLKVEELAGEMRALRERSEQSVVTLNITAADLEGFNEEALNTHDSSGSSSSSSSSSSLYSASTSGMSTRSAPF